MALKLPNPWRSFTDCQGFDLLTNSQQTVLVRKKRPQFKITFLSQILIIFPIYKQVPFRMRPLVIAHADVSVAFIGWIDLAPAQNVQPTA